MKNMKYKVLAADDEFWSRKISEPDTWEEYSLGRISGACM